MSHLLHRYIADQLAERLIKHRIVVWYDPRAEFEEFVSELDGDSIGDGLVRASVAGTTATLALHDGSFYSMRTRIEPVVEEDEPQFAILYLPGVGRDPNGSVLMELELAGCRWEPQLRQLARIALRQRYTDGVIDEVLSSSRLTYHDIVAASAGDGAAGPSVLRALLHGQTSEDQLASWLADSDLDPSIKEKDAALELGRLVKARLGIELPDGDLAKWRAITSRFVLGIEFRSDLTGDPPPELEHLAAVKADAQRNARSICISLRTHHPDRYSHLADRAEHELGLTAASVAPFHLGAIDTFRFEEKSLAAYCARLVADGAFSEALDIANARFESFWLRRTIERQAQWEAIRLAAELGMAVDAIHAELARLPGDASAYVERYARNWHQVDRAQRQFEAWLPKLDEDADDRMVAVVRQRYDAVVALLATEFAAAVTRAGWVINGQLQQTAIYDSIVRPMSGRVAYVLVDAMRYEMGVELMERLSLQGEVTIRAAVSVLPSITEMGMSALMPGASKSYDVVEAAGRLAGRVGNAILPDLNARKKYLAALVPSSVDLTLSEVQALSSAKLARKLGSAERVIVRSQEIDYFGEGGFQARAIMDTVIDNLARAVRKLAAAGVDQAVITADHGHLFSAEDRDESMRIDAPGGNTIDLHRRCWIGRGGTTPASCVRVSAASLGNDADFDFVFPAGIGVFRSGGDLAFHHGGPSLQEMIIPVITTRSGKSVAEPTSGGKLSVTDVPETITNRIFSVKLSLATLETGVVPVRPVLIAGDAQVGSVGMAVGAELDRGAGTVELAQGSGATVGFVLDDDTVEAVKIVILDPATDAELYRSPAALPVRLGVA